jgi:hypothetical protein
MTARNLGNGYFFGYFYFGPDNRQPLPRPA